MMDILRFLDSKSLPKIEKLPKSTSVNLPFYGDILWPLLAIFLRHEDCVTRPKNICVEA